MCGMPVIVKLGTRSKDRVGQEEQGASLREMCPVCHREAQISASPLYSEVPSRKHYQRFKD